MAPQFLRMIPILRMFDTAKAREFYGDFLGFSVDWEHRYAPDLPLYMQISLNGAVLHLSEHHGDATPGAKVMIEVRDLRPYHASLLGKRYGYMRPGLEDEAWGALTMTVIDPFMNRLVFAERKTDIEMA